MQSFRLIAAKLSEEMIIQACHSVLARNCKISKSKNALILSKMFFSLPLFNMPGIFVQTFKLIAEKLSSELIIQTSHSVLARNCKISKSTNTLILSKMYFHSKREVHIFSTPASFVQSFRQIA